jgi:hypothetical protein
VRIGCEIEKQARVTKYGTESLNSQLNAPDENYLCRVINIYRLSVQV